MSKYKDTLNLPKTSYPIKASAKREEELVKIWEDDGVYKRLTVERPNSQKFILHDGPPYANGHIHHGHILNKVLKDIIVKSRYMMGYNVEFKPGWDCHGLPIELEVDKQLGSKRHEMSKVELRKAYRDYANKFVDTQKAEFKRLGVLADWNNPYLTMDNKYEAETLRQLAKFVDAGLVYRDLRSINWCPNHKTALAETEIIHKEHKSPSAYVAFKALSDDRTYFVVWTTTPWTLYSNAAIAVSPNAEYKAYEVMDGRRFVIAADCAEQFFKTVVAHNPVLEYCGLYGSYKGSELEGKTYQSLFDDTVYKVVVDDYVKTNTGTGCVHIAPAHGEDDFRIGVKHKLPILNAVDEKGERDGHKIEAINAATMLRLKELGVLLNDHNDTITHQYPYSERSNKPVITRATKQWFIALDKPFNGGTTLRERALWALHQVRWLPDWGYKRIEGMIRTRPDWCISRQRTWGVPIISFKCIKCDHISISAEHIKLYAKYIVEKNKLDEMFDDPTSDFACNQCGGKVEVETDVLDVWFDSGVSNAAVMGGYTVDLYLEGSDQHRGWFQSTLLAALGAGNPIPYKAVLTHGFVVDDKGEKLSKSKKNYIDPFKFINQNGAELLRLWVAQSEYTNDVKVSQEVLDGVKQTAHKIRNTIRFLISNLYDFSPKTHKPEKLLDVDQYILNKTALLYNKCVGYYEDYDFHNVVKDVENLCINDISGFYANVSKDRLYCDHTNSDNRRSAQMAMFLVAGMLIRIMAPIMSFSMSDAWDAMPKMDNDPKTVFEATIKRSEKAVNEFNGSKYSYLNKIREISLKKLEELRREGKIGAAYEADAKVYVSKDWFYKLDLLEAGHILGVSHLTLVARDNNEPDVEVYQATGEQCSRCWYYSSLKPGSDICNRCSKVLSI